MTDQAKDKTTLANCCPEHKRGGRCAASVALLGHDPHQGKVYRDQELCCCRAGFCSIPRGAATTRAPSSVAPSAAYTPAPAPVLEPEAAWRASSTLQAEFPTPEIYGAFCRGKADGRFRVLSNPKEGRHGHA